MNSNLGNIILIDCDGVLLNWEHSFVQFMETYSDLKRLPDADKHYNIAKQYGISNKSGKYWAERFNTSAAIGSLPPFRDAIKYVRKLHEEHGYVFHCITSMSDDKYAVQLRVENLERVFGKGIFERIVCLPVGADKTDTLFEYKDSDYYWIEDKVANAMVGLDLGLEPIIVEHVNTANQVEAVESLFQSLDDCFYAVKWKDIYNHITGEES